MMRVLKAHVKDGRVVVDEPTEFPEGSEVRVALVDDDEMDEAELEAGLGVSEDQLWATLRALR